MTNQGRTIKRYSIGFKHKVVREIEEEGISIGQIRRRYNIKGAETVQKWIRKFGKEHLLNSIIRIEMRDEKDRIQELEAEVKNLKIALADTVLARDVYKTTIEVADEHYQTDLKKKFGRKSSPGQKKNMGSQ